MVAPAVSLLNNNQNDFDVIKVRARQTLSQVVAWRGRLVYETLSAPKLNIKRRGASCT